MSEPGKAIKFIVGGRYANRRGEYEVLQIKGNTMRVRYDDNTEQELTIEAVQKLGIIALGRKIGSFENCHF